MAVAGEQLLIGIARVPDPRLRHELKSGAMNYRCRKPLRVRPEVDGGPEDPLEGVDQPPILRAALLHPKGVEHGRGAVERDSVCLLANCHRCQEDWNQAVLSPGQTVAWVPRHLKNELPVSPPMQKTPGARSTDRETAQDERSSAETEILPVGLTILAHHLDGFDLSQPPFGDHEVRVLAPKQIVSVSEVRVLCLVGQGVDPRRTSAG